MVVGGSNWAMVGSSGVGGNWGVVSSSNWGWIGSGDWSVVSSDWCVISSGDWSGDDGTGVVGVVSA
jgi:hypothetical protein